MFGNTKINEKEAGVGPIEKAFKDTGAKRVFVITDYFGAANSNMYLEIEQGLGYFILGKKELNCLFKPTLNHQFKWTQ